MAACDAYLQPSCVLLVAAGWTPGCCRVEADASARSASATSRHDATTAGCAISVCSGEAGSLTHLQVAQAEQLKIVCLFSYKSWSSQHLADVWPHRSMLEGKRLQSKAALPAPALAARTIADPRHQHLDSEEPAHSEGGTSIQ